MVHLSISLFARDSSLFKESLPNQGEPRQGFWAPCGFFAFQKSWVSNIREPQGCQGSSVTSSLLVRWLGELWLSACSALARVTWGKSRDPFVPQFFYLSMGF